MRYLHQEVKTRKGETIKVEVSAKTRVMIMSQREFKQYQKPRTFTYFGGIKEGSYEFISPKDSRWVVVVEKGTWKEPINISAQASIIPAAPKAVRPKQEEESPEIEDEMTEEVTEDSEK
jgi:hypothetical protein